MSTISTAVAWALAFVALLLPPPAAAQDEASSALTVRVAPGVTAEATGIGGATVTVRLSPGGTTQRLTVTAGDGDGHSHAESADFNFDGVQDLAFVATVGQVNDSYQVFLFDAATRRFVELQPPRHAPPVNCDGFWNLKPDPKTHTLLSSCRSGPIWYTDAYRFDDQGRIYVSQATSPILSDAAQAMFDPTDGAGPVSLALSYDPRGKIIERSVLAYGDDPQAAAGHVAVERLPLHEQPRQGPTRRYLVKGDAFQALDISDDQDWLKVAYRNAAKGRIEGWIKVGDATPAP